jgi:hypothetical protein
MNLAQCPISTSLQEPKDSLPRAGELSRLGCASSLDPMDRLLQELGQLSPVGSSPELLFPPSYSQGLKKISAYMKSSRFLPAPMFAKLAHWNSK